MRGPTAPVEQQDIDRLQLILEKMLKVLTEIKGEEKK